MSDSLQSHGLGVSLSMGFSRQEYLSGLPCPPAGDFPDPGIEPTLRMSPALASGFFTTSATGEAPYTNMPKTKNERYIYIYFQTQQCFLHTVGILHRLNKTFPEKHSIYMKSIRYIFRYSYTFREGNEEWAQSQRKKQDFINHLIWIRTRIQHEKLKRGSMIIRKVHIKQIHLKQRPNIMVNSGNKKFDRDILLKIF